LPKRQHLLRRNGTYYLRLRIPQDLLKAKAYGNKKEIKHSLGTKERTKAERLAATRLVEWEEDFAEKRQTLADRRNRASCRRSRGEIATVATNKAELRLLSDLSKLEQQDLIVRIFVRLEKDSREIRAIPPKEKDEVDEALKEVSYNRDAYMEALPQHLPINWADDLEGELLNRGIEIDPEGRPIAEEMAKCLQRAHIENAWRTEQVLQGNHHRRLDPLFESWHADSELHESDHVSTAIAGKCIEELCDAYIAHKKKAKGGSLAPKTLDSYVMPKRVLMDFFGARTPLTKITNEDAQRLVVFLAELPKNATKRYSGKSVEEASKLEKAKHKPSYISARRQGLLFAALCAFWGCPFYTSAAADE